MKPKTLKNIPKKIYLQIGEDCPDDVDFKELSLDDITWWADKINANDLEYIHKSDIAGLMSEEEIRRVVEETAWKIPRETAQHYNIHYGIFHEQVAHAVHKLWLKKCGVKGE